MIRECLFAEGRGLVAKLLRYLTGHEDVVLMQGLADLLWNGMKCLSGDRDLERLELKRDYLERAHPLAKRLRNDERARVIAACLGTTYLRIGDALPVNQCYEKGYRKACFFFNISGRERGRTLVELSYLKRVAGKFDHLRKWVEKYIWNNEGVDRATHVTMLAEQLREYGEQGAARVLYAEAARYERKRLEGSEIQDRHLEISESLKEAIERDDREILKSARQRVKIAISRKESVSKIQEMFGREVIELIETLYLQAVHLIGLPPCSWCLVGLGSLARGEMAVCSDLDAIVLVEEESKEVSAYFEKVGNYFELLVMNLGETPDGFCLDPAALHPAKMIVTPEQLIAQQVRWLEQLSPKVDVDPIVNALRLPCRLTGSDKLFDIYVKKLLAVQDKFADQCGSYLLSRWKIGQKLGEEFDVKSHLYRPITLLVDALSVRFNIPKFGTRERLEALAKVLPRQFIEQCVEALDLACRLRLEVQMHYGKEKETVFLTPTLKVKNAFVLSSADQKRLKKIDEGLFIFLREIDLTDRIDYNAFVQDLASAQQLTNKALQGALCTYPNLTSLLLARSDRLTTLNFLPKLVPNLKSLELTELSGLKNISGDTLFSKKSLVLAQLERLTISDCKFTRLALRAQQLKHLSWQNSTSSQLHFGFKPARFISLSTDSRKFLDQFFCFVKPKIVCFKRVRISTMMVNLPQLTSIQCDGENVTLRSGPQSRAEKLAHELYTNGFTLRDPSTDSTTVHSRPGKLEVVQQVLEAVGTQYEEITHLDFSGFSKMSDNLFFRKICGENPFGPSCRNLTHLNLAGCTALTSFPHFLAIGPSLVHLNIEGCPNLSGYFLQSTIEFNPGLAFARNAQGDLLSQEEIIRRRQPMRVAMENLDFRDGSEVTDKEVIRRVKTYIGLTHIDLKPSPSVCKLTKLTDRSLIAISEYCPELESLSVSGWDSMTDDGIISLVTGCPGLVSLDLSHINLTDKALIAIAKCCPNLTSLQLGFCEITDKGITALTKGCQQLADLSLVCCFGLTDVSVGAIEQNCSSLTAITIDTSRLSKDARMRIKKLVPEAMIRW